MPEDPRQYLDEVNKKRGFKISDLPPHTKVHLKTKHSFYDIEVLSNNEALIFGGLLPDQSLRFSSPTRICVQGSTWGGSMLKLGWIGEWMRLEFFEIETRSSISTSAVLSAVFEAPDGSWEYSTSWETN
jgi:hypothetical protein